MERRPEGWVQRFPVACPDRRCVRLWERKWRRHTEEVICNDNEGNLGTVQRLSGILWLQCPNRAISLSNGKAFIDQEICSSCQICAEVCPTGALQI